MISNTDRLRRAEVRRPDTPSIDHHLLERHRRLDHPHLQGVFARRRREVRGDGDGIVRHKAIGPTPCSGERTSSGDRDEVLGGWSAIVDLESEAERAVIPVRVEGRRDVGSDKDRVAGLGVEVIEVVFAVRGTS
jgi:hypothetical protein